MPDLEELKALFTETVFTHRWTLLEGYHEAGKIISKSKYSYAQIAAQTGQRVKTIHYCVELYKAYPKLSSLPDGKNVSWYKITKTLTPYEEDSAKAKRKIKKAK